jgi:hypothetical protein
MKTMMVERVSNPAGRGKGTRCAHPLTRAKEKTRRLQSLFRKGGPKPGGPNLSIAAAALDVIGRNEPFNLATTGKNDCRAQTEMIDATHTRIYSFGTRQEHNLLISSYPSRRVPV